MTKTAVKDFVAGLTTEQKKKAMACIYSPTDVKPWRQRELLKDICGCEKYVDYLFSDDLEQFAGDLVCLEIISRLQEEK